MSTNKTHESAKQKNVFLCHDARAIKSALLKKYSSSMKLNKLQCFQFQVNLLGTLTKIKENVLCLINQDLVILPSMLLKKCSILMG